MKLDIHTLAFTLSLVNILQVLALGVLYRLNLSYHGIGFWAVGTGLCSLGFLCNYLRGLPGIGPYAILANNMLFIGGFLVIYTGVLRFFEQKERRGPLVAVCGAVTLTAWYFTFVHDSQSARRVVISLAVGGVFLMIARALFIYRNRSVTMSATFLCAVFSTGGVVFLVRGMTPFFALSPGSLFTPSPTQVLTYLIALVMSTLWTMGFIIMALQRSAFENCEAKSATELALESERAMLKEQQQFLSMVSHEFRTPLAVIDSAATNLTAVPPQDQIELDQRAEQIMRATRILAHLIENCITTERVEQGGFAVTPQETAIPAFIADIVHSTGIHAKDAVIVDCSEAPVTWHLDPTLVRIALANLIDNALKYSDDERALIRVQTGCGCLLIRVENKGQVIGPDEAEMMFSKFVRGRTVTNGRNVRGSGLGLFISRRIAQAHGGNVRFVAVQPGVTVFEIVIPELH
jgi:signal transduction histidine kinase